MPVTGLGGRGQWYAHCLIPEGAVTLAEYDHPFLAGYPAVTTHRHAKGRLTMLGCFPDRTLSGALARWVAAESLPVDPWRAAVGPTQSHLACRTTEGRSLHVIHNWAWQPSRYVLPASVTLLDADTSFSPGQPIELGAWDVQILLEKGDTS
jgi:beta-galactosidase